MLRLAGGFCGAAVVAAAVMANATSALADSGRDFFQKLSCGAASCEISAGSRQSVPGAPAAPGEAFPASGRDSSPARPSCFSPRGVVDGASALVSGPVSNPVPEGASCSASFAAAGEAGPAAADPRVVAESVRASMELPELVLGSAPPEGADMVVNVPVWLWAERGSWAPESASAGVAAGSVSVAATPVELAWEMGDGHTVTCQGPGTVFELGRHRGGTESPDCGHTYTTASADEPGKTFDVRARTRWQVAWSATDGQGGELDPLYTQAEARARVIEIHTLVTRG